MCISFNYYKKFEFICRNYRSQYDIYFQMNTFHNQGSHGATLEFHSLRILALFSNISNLIKRILVFRNTDKKKK